MNFSADFHSLLSGSLLTLLSGLQEAGHEFVDAAELGLQRHSRTTSLLEWLGSLLKGWAAGMVVDF
jgi:hypothetical protein